MKNTITTITLAIVMTFGATLANANGGIIVGDRNATPTCETQKDGIIVAGRDGIIVAGRDGIIVAGFTFIANMFSGQTTSPCTSARDGIIVGD